MYQVMIIDEDAESIEQVMNAVSWTDYNCQVVGTACNGVDALEQAHKREPDIIFTGINMPNMDGLSLMAALRNEYPEMQMTILSRYSNFIYAQRGIELGVARYLLKPSSSKELEEALHHMIEQLDFYKNYGVPNGKDMDNLISDNFIVQSALHFMEEHYNEPLTLPYVAEQVFVSQWHLSKLISKTTDKSFNEILNGIRVERAKELLEHTTLQIQEISKRVGFNDATHFARVFKRQQSERANQYRNRVNALKTEQNSI